MGLFSSFFPVSVGNKDVFLYHGNFTYAGKRREAA